MSGRRPRHVKFLWPPCIAQLASRIFGQNALIVDLSKPEVVGGLILKVQRVVVASLACPFSLGDDLRDRLMRILVVVDGKQLSGKELIVDDLVPIRSPVGGR